MTRGKLWARCGAILAMLSAVLITACSVQDRKGDYVTLHNTMLGPKAAAIAGTTQAARDSKGNSQRLIPYTDLLVYPENWVDLTHNQGAATRPAPSGDSGLAGQEEVWVIQKPARPATTMPTFRLADRRVQTTEPAAAESAAAFPIPSAGTLAAKEASGKLVPVPLRHTDVSAQITGYIASVSVTQQFQNPYDSKIEAVYVFPLPENAGINEFVMTIGQRHIRGIIREREEAQKTYQEARRQGYVASLMTQERPNIFTQSVANIEPGKQIDIQIKYFHTLTYNDGWYEWVFPMVVGPRYNPAGSTEGVGAVARDNRGASGQSTEIQYLRPTERSGHDIALTVALDPGVAISDITSVNHQIRRRDDAEHRTIVELDPRDSMANKDFVLRYKVAGDKVRSGLFVQRDKDGKGGHFTLMIIPPETLASLPRRPVEMVLVVDTSGSMSGQPIAQAKAAVDVALTRMDRADTFQVVQFDSDAQQMFPNAVPATDANIARARQYVRTMQGAGGTEMLKGINAALAFPHDENRTRVVAFLTDGYIGNEIEILKALHQQLENSRAFSFGVGSSPNRYLLDSMAIIGHGTAAYLSLNEPAKPVMDTYFERISHPALANIKVNFQGMQVTDVYPRHIPELFVGRPIILTGRFTGDPTGDISVVGKVGRQEMRFDLPTDKKASENPAIATVWARMKIADLQEQSIYDDRDISKDIREVALTHGLMSAYTSFVAVDSSRQTAGDHGTTVAVPVPVPEGVRYETTIQEGKSP